MTQLYYLNATAWNGERINGVLYGRDIENWDDLSLSVIGLYRPLPPYEPPAGKYIVGKSLQIVDGLPRYVYELTDTPPKPEVPYSISPLQARKVLRIAGAKALVDGYVLTLSEEAQEEWNYATEIRRDNQIIAAGAASLGWTETQVDDLFILGATL